MDDFEKNQSLLRAQLAKTEKNLETIEKERKRLLGCMRSFVEKEMDLREDLTRATSTISSLENEMRHFLRLIQTGDTNTLKMIETRLVARFKDEVQD